MALSDPEGILASPFTIIDRRDEARDIESLTSLVTQHQVEWVIVGLPLSMDGGLGPQAEKVKAFTEKLRGATGVPVEYRDERLTTVAAQRLLRGAAAGKKRRKTRDDAAAAALILQSYLDEEHALD